MISRHFLFIWVLPAAMVLTGDGSRAMAAERDLTLWYNQPAAKWVEALPVGNGRLGAMVFGGVDGERIQLNEETVWAGPPVPEPHEGIRKAMAEARKAWFAGDYARAHQVLQASLPPRITPRSHQTLGDLHLKVDLAGQPESYRRELNLDTGVAATRFSIGGVTHVREVFATAVDQVIVVRHSADKRGAVNMEIWLDRPADFEAKAAGDDALAMTGQAQHDGKHLGVKWHARLAVKTEGGSIRAEGNRLRVKAALPGAED